MSFALIYCFMKLRCACCGGDAGNFKQWWNQDTGFGICLRCLRAELQRNGPEETQRSYGRPGVHYENPTDA